MRPVKGFPKIFFLLSFFLLSTLGVSLVAFVFHVNPTPRRIKDEEKCAGADNGRRKTFFSAWDCCLVYVK